MAKAAVKATSDTRIEALYRDCQDLARYIARARSEIARLRPHELRAEKLPHAGKELDTIVKETESATNEIMAATEEIMAADASNLESYKALVDSSCMRIFEACSFQDITGQRIRKVVKTLSYIEDRLEGLMRIMGPEVPDAAPEDQPLGDARLLHGPQLHGQGIRQDEVDAMFSGDGGIPASAPMPTPKAAAPKPAAAPAAPPKAAAPAKPAAKPEPKAETKVDAKADPKKENSQSDIDALFDDAPKPEPGAALDQSAIDALFD